MVWSLPRVSDEAETLSASYLAARFTDVLRPVRKTVARHLDGGIVDGGNCGSVNMVSSSWAKHTPTVTWMGNTCDGRARGIRGFRTPLS